jgi:hypothetical protein
VEVLRHDRFADHERLTAAVSDLLQRDRLDP